MIRFGSCEVRMNRAKDTFWVPDGVLGHAKIPGDISQKCGQCFGLPRDQGKRNSPQKMKSGWALHNKFFFSALFLLKNDSQGSFRARRDPQGHKQVKNVRFKFWSFLAKLWTSSWKKVDFWTKYKYSFNSFRSNQCVRKCSLDHFEGLPRDQG